MVVRQEEMLMTEAVVCIHCAGTFTCSDTNSPPKLLEHTKNSPRCWFLCEFPRTNGLHAVCSGSPCQWNTISFWEMALLCCGDPGVWCYCLSVALSVLIMFILSFCYGNEIVSLVLMVVVLNIFFVCMYDVISSCSPLSLFGLINRMCIPLVIF